MIRSGALPQAACSYPQPGCLWGRVGLMTAEVIGQTSILTFILFWTIANNLVHLF